MAKDQLTESDKRFDRLSRQNKQPERRVVEQGQREQENIRLLERE